MDSGQFMGLQRVRTDLVTEQQEDAILKIKYERALTKEVIIILKFSPDI